MPAQTSGGSGNSPKKKKPRTAKSKGIKAPEIAVDKDEANRAERPVLRVGSRAWHRGLGVDVTVIKVYYDDLPPYYDIRLDDGSERATIRSKLDSQEEHEAEVAEAEHKAAEARAEACAAALLAEEETTSKKAGGQRGAKAKPSRK
eukprot:CAMPEP_0174752552 /NCGR_PEP_ID=MMETSP1094-20130205/102305_1 /TAXON_ID=156173 /ORGANISM="Chrysochromulina brevifilum, Strain UTEX LB 985" /LENGTH=145 /DNA_ID=CAMNT_0015958207 /DNA_START=67 /DNA_END=504 /DNA_ORIENTATION=+